MHFIESIIHIFQRDLAKLKTELQSYADEKSIWLTAPGITNTAGNLCLHIIGNLTTYIGNGLGNRGYVRNRELEFSQKNVPVVQLIRMIDETAVLISTVLQNTDASQPDADFPMVIWEKPMPFNYTLIQLAIHLNYHLGQINYHRRLLDKP